MKKLPLFENHFRASVEKISEQDFLKQAGKFSISDLQSKEHVIFRGINSAYPDYAKVTETGRRKSANQTLNYYTLWINNHPDWSDFPKREHICTTDVSVASTFGNVYNVIPGDLKQKIGLLGETDIWDSIKNSYIELASEHEEVLFTLASNMPFEDSHVKDILGNFQKWIMGNTRVIGSYEELVDKLERAPESGYLPNNPLCQLAEVAEKTAYEMFSRIFSPDSLRCEVVTYQELAQSFRGADVEVWMDGTIFIERVWK